MNSIERTLIKKHWTKITVILTIVLAFWAIPPHIGSSMSFSGPDSHDDFDSWCPLADPDPMKITTDNLRSSKEFSLDASVKKQVQRLAAAVKCPTES